MPSNFPVQFFAGNQQLLHCYIAWLKKKANNLLFFAHNIFFFPVGKGLYSAGCYYATKSPFLSEISDVFDLPTQVPQCVFCTAMGSVTSSARAFKQLRTGSHVPLPATCPSYGRALGPAVTGTSLVSSSAGSGNPDLSVLMRQTSEFLYFCSTVLHIFQSLTKKPKSPLQMSILEVAQ